MKKINKSELVEILTNLGNAAIVGCVLETNTEPTLVGKGKPKNVRKITANKVTLNSIYQNKVNKQLDKENKETNFESAGDPAWKKRISRLLSVHKEDSSKIYLDYMPENVIMETYLRDNKPVDKESLAEWLRERSSETRQGTDSPIPFRHVSLDNIVSLKIQDELFVLQ